MSKQVELITQKKKSPPVASKKAKSAAKPEKKSHKKAAPAPPAKAKTSKPAAKSGAVSKAPYVTYEQKQDISNRINSLPEAKMGQALNIIRDNMPKLKVRSLILRRIAPSFELRAVLELAHIEIFMDAYVAPVLYRVWRMTSSSWTLMNWTMTSSTNFFNL